MASLPLDTLAALLVGPQPETRRRLREKVQQEMYLLGEAWPVRT